MYLRTHSSKCVQESLSRHRGKTLRQRLAKQAALAVEVGVEKGEGNDGVHEGDAQSQQEDNHELKGYRTS